MKLAGRSFRISTEVPPRGCNGSGATGSCLIFVPYRAVEVEICLSGALSDLASGMERDRLGKRKVAKDEKCLQVILLLI